MNLKCLKYLRYLMLFIIGFLFFSLIFPPLFSVFNRIEPWVLGMPFLQFWLLVFSFGVSAAMLVLWKIDGILDREETDNNG